MTVSELPPLRDYQEQAIEAALARGSLLLAMTMGSGKTRTAIETVEQLVSQGLVQGGAVFVLNSTKFQWKREIEQWGTGSVLVIDGTKAKRLAQYQEAHRYQYVILNYEALIHDWKLITEFLPIDFIVADEVTSIKSFDTKKSRRLKLLGTACDFRFGLSGQPVENRPEELFSIMEFIDPDVLGNFFKFDKTFIRRDNFGRPTRYVNLPTLHQKLGPAMFRRSRADIAHAMPSVVDLATPILLGKPDQALYQRMKLDLLDTIEMALASGMGDFNLFAHYGQEDDDASSALKGSIMSKVTTMRLLCDHPDLLRRSAEKFDDEDVAGGSQYANELLTEGLLDKLGQASPKLSILMERLDSILNEDPNHKVVIFSGFTNMLDLIEEALKASDITSPWCRLSGDVSSANRDKAIVKFNTDPDVRIFLSSDAGAYGVNLDAGSHLISYDLPWSAGSYAQRVSRIDRLSTIHGVIYIDNLYMDGTIEAWQYALLRQKAAVASAFIDGVYDQKGGLTLELSNLKNFLESS